MKVLFIGGTGNISTAVTELAVEQGIELTLLRRGQRESNLPADVRTITADIHDEAAADAALGQLTGRDASEALLDAVFARFCIGK